MVVRGELMSGQRPRFLFFDGKIVPYAHAKVHVLSTVFKYAAAVFEGIRAYRNEKTDKLYVFRLTEHLERLFDSAKIARIPIPYGADELKYNLLKLIHQNELREDLHIRISAYVAEDDGRLHSTGPVGLSMAAMPMGRYDALAPSEGLRVAVSPWRRLGDDTMPPRVKSIANYQNSRLALLDAQAAGFQDAILLDARGKVTEGPGYNIFVVRGGQVLTPPVTSGILEGVTRDTLIRLFAEKHRMNVVQREIDRSELYVAEEVFFCGSGKEVTPIGSIDHRAVGNGGIGPLTEAIRETYFDVAKGRHQDFASWLTPIY
jgi:branched-chain amino acid aminotransferase